MSICAFYFPRSYLRPSIDTVFLRGDWGRFILYVGDLCVHCIIVFLGLGLRIIYPNAIPHIELYEERSPEPGILLCLKRESNDRTCEPFSPYEVRSLRSFMAHELDLDTCSFPRELKQCIFGRVEGICTGLPAPPCALAHPLPSLLCNRRCPYLDRIFCAT